MHLKYASVTVIARLDANSTASATHFCGMGVSVIISLEMT